MAYTVKYIGGVKHILHPPSLPYRNKIAELHSRVEAGAKELQTVEEAKELSLQEITKLGGREEKLIRSIKKTEEAHNEAKDNLRLAKAQKQGYLKSVAKEVAKEKATLVAIKEEKRDILPELEALESVVKELSSFISKHKEARKEYLTEKAKLEKAKVSSEKISIHAQEVSKEIEQKNKDLDGYKEAMTSFSSKLTTAFRNLNSLMELESKNLSTKAIRIKLKLRPDMEVEVPFLKR